MQKLETKFGLKLTYLIPVLSFTCLLFYMVLVLTYFHVCCSGPVKFDLLSRCHLPNRPRTRLQRKLKYLLFPIIGGNKEKKGLLRLLYTELPHSLHLLEPDHLQKYSVGTHCI